MFKVHSFPPCLWHTPALMSSTEKREDVIEYLLTEKRKNTFFYFCEICVHRLCSMNDMQNEEQMDETYS